MGQRDLLAGAHTRPDQQYDACVLQRAFVSDLSSHIDRLMQMPTRVAYPRPGGAKTTGGDRRPTSTA